VFVAWKKVEVCGDRGSNDRLWLGWVIGHSEVGIPYYGESMVGCVMLGGVLG
jgi:hypothetical protein